MNDFDAAMAVVGALIALWWGWSICDRRLPRMLVAVMFGALACRFAVTNGVPFWRVAPMGDGYDIGLTVFLFACFAFKDGGAKITINNNAPREP